MPCCSTASIPAGSGLWHAAWVAPPKLINSTLPLAICRDATISTDAAHSARKSLPPSRDIFSRSASIRSISWQAWSNRCACAHVSINGSVKRRRWATSPQRPAASSMPCSIAENCPAVSSKVLSGQAIGRQDALLRHCSNEASWCRKAAGLPCAWLFPRRSPRAGCRGFFLKSTDGLAKTDANREAGSCLIPDGSGRALRYHFALAGCFPAIAAAIRGGAFSCPLYRTHVDMGNRYDGAPSTLVRISQLTPSGQRHLLPGSVRR